MVNKRNNDSKTDDLLKQVLKDDLPLEVEGRMKAQFNQYRGKIEQDTRLSRWGFFSGWKSALRPGRTVRREVLALSSLIMIVVGAFLHVSGHRSAIAETLSFLNISVSVADQIENASSME